MSRYLNPQQLSALNRIGDVMNPGLGDLPSFSQTECVARVDGVLSEMGQQDLQDLKMLLGVFYHFPRWIIQIVLGVLTLWARLPGRLGALPRLILIGLKGLVMTLYYSETSSLKIIGYETKVLTDDLTSY